MSLTIWSPPATSLDPKLSEPSAAYGSRHGRGALDLALLAGVAAVTIPHPEPMELRRAMTVWVTVLIFNVRLLRVDNRPDRRHACGFIRCWNSRAVRHSRSSWRSSPWYAVLGAHAAVPMGALPALPPDFRWLAYRAAGAGARDLVRAPITDDRLLARPVRPAHVERLGVAAMECIEGAPRHLRGFQLRTMSRPILSPRSDPARRTRSSVAPRKGSVSRRGDGSTRSNDARKLVKYKHVAA